MSETPANPNPAQTEAQAPAPGTPEYDAAMAAKFEKASAPEGTTPAANAQTPPAETKTEGTKEPPVNPAGESQFKKGEAEGAAALQAVGLDYSKYAAEFAQNGKLSDATYAEMAAKNIPREVVDAHIQAQTRVAEAEAEAIRNDIFTMVGGEEAYGEMVQWALKNVPRADLEAFDKLLEEGSLGQVKLAVQGLFSAFQNSNGKEPSLLGGGRSESKDVYRSVAELTADMRDPRYEKDPAFRADVQAKLGRSNIM